MKDLIAAVDIGATKITVSICNRDGFLIRLYQRTRLQGDERTIPDQVREMIVYSMERIDADGKPSAVGISTAGPFGSRNDMIELVSPNICGGMAPERGILPNDWKSVPLEKVLREDFDDPVIQNDAVSGVVAERTFGAGIGFDNLVYVTWSTGIGTGAYVDGRLIRGKNGNAPHGGHVYLGDDGPKCGCGNRFDMEAVASGTAISAAYGGEKSAKDVFRLYTEGDKKAKNVVKEAARYFARGLASVNSVLDTKLFIIGGSVYLNNEKLLLPMVEEEFYRAFPALTEDVIFRRSGLGEYLGDIAAVSLVIPGDWMDRWKDKKPWEDAPETIHIE